MASRLGGWTYRVLNIRWYRDAHRGGGREDWMLFTITKWQFPREKPLFRRPEASRNDLIAQKGRNLLEGGRRGGSSF
ncbi:hypothetical protein CEXT_605481 [Caerostris extrusa]|uniref:Uncharacterized protein n=1 Tax=Caerostris extrusa TaxID=172846 RepID=A0AAV4VFC2_CAEEX|nr:hypothetical protein CEXT_605481 [Caerostris extrusa]